MTTLATPVRDASAASPRRISPAPESFTSPDDTVVEIPPCALKSAFEVSPAPVRVAGVGREIYVKIASERAEWEQAFHLAAITYRARGYEVASSRPLRFLSYHALPDTVTFVAKHESHVVATFSIVPDNTLLGMPMESIYGDEVATLRRRGCRMAETICLADTGLSVREFLQVFIALIKLAIQYHHSRGGDTYVITVNPRHKSFYAKVLGFQPLGPCRSYANVQDAPAEALWGNPEVVAAHAPRMYEEIFGKPLPDESLRAPRVPRDLVRYFDQQSSMADSETVQAVLDYVDRYGSPRRW
jgi:hypothetical protein